MKKSTENKLARITKLADKAAEMAYKQRLVRDQADELLQALKKSDSWDEVLDEHPHWREGIDIYDFMC